jgi:hypothetical protein
VLYGYRQSPKPGFYSLILTLAERKKNPAVGKKVTHIFLYYFYLAPSLKLNKMYKRKNPYRKFILVSVFLSAIFVACEKDKTVNTDNTPAHHITESENLVIPAAVDLPPNAPGGNVRVATFFAQGFQKYKAQEIPGSTPVEFQWVFVAPLADLFDATNAKVGTHSTGPTWQLIGSTTDSIYGQAFAPAKTAPSPDVNSIDWLLLKPKDGKAPTGIFANVLYIQRIATTGGKAPLAAPTNVSETVNVPYTAIYRFTKKTP